MGGFIEQKYPQVESVNVNVNVNATLFHSIHQVDVVGVNSKLLNLPFYPFSSANVRLVTTHHSPLSQFAMAFNANKPFNQSNWTEDGNNNLSGP